MARPEPASSLARQTLPWVLGALLILGLVALFLYLSAPEENLLHRDYEIL